MAKTLDKSRDYGQVFGKPGIDFEQDHCYFNLAGVQVDYDGNPVKHAADHAKALAAEEKNSEGDQFDDMNAAELKAMVESYGGTYSKKAEAISYLRGMQKPSQAA